MLVIGGANRGTFVLFLFKDHLELCPETKMKILEKWDFNVYLVTQSGGTINLSRKEKKLDKLEIITLKTTHFVYTNELALLHYLQLQ